MGLSSILERRSSLSNPDRWLIRMVGGDPATFEKIKPIIACFAAKIVHVGPVGAGHTMKLINNFVRRTL